MQEAGHETMQDFLYHFDRGDVWSQTNEEYGSNVKNFNTRHNILWDALGTLDTLVKETPAAPTHPFTGIFKFTFVRNPWDRFSSLYHYHKEDFGGLGTFNEFINNLKDKRGKIFNPTSDTTLRLTQTQFLSVGDNCENTHERSQDSGYTGMHPKRGTNSKLMIDYVGRLETITQDIANITQKLDGLYNGTDRFWMRNRGDFTQRERISLNSKQSYIKMYKDFDSIYAVFEYYYDDIVNFGYTFSGYSNCEITKECFRKKG